MLANEIIFGETKYIGATVYNDQLGVVSSCINVSSVSSGEKRLYATFYYLRQCLREKQLTDIKFTPSDLNCSDALTKPTNGNIILYVGQQNLLVVPSNEVLSGKRRAKRHNATLSQAALL